MPTLSSAGSIAALTLLVATPSQAQSAWADPDVPLTLAGPAPVQDALFTKAALGAAYSWNETELAPALSIARDEDALASPDHDGVNTVFFSEEWPGNRDQLALTYTHRRNGVIVEADLAINVAHHRFAVGDDDHPSAFDLQNLIVHELGHVLGLPHLEEADASMFDRILPGETKKRDLDEADLAALEALYVVRPHDTGGCAASSSPDLALSSFAVLALITLARRRIRPSLRSDPIRGSGSTNGAR